MTPWPGELERLLRRAYAAEADALETACEAALCTGTDGVLVDGDGIRVSSDVPYGTIHVVLDPSCLGRGLRILEPRDGS